MNYKENRIKKEEGYDGYRNGCVQVNFSSVQHLHARIEALQQFTAKG